VPPVAETVTVVEPPKQAIVPEEEEAVSCVGCVTVILVVEVHPLASVTVKVYVPAVRVKLPVPV
jgi:Ni,Fe-hydrogenase III component G